MDGDSGLNLEVKAQPATGRERLETAIRAVAPAVWDWDFANRTFLASEGLAHLLGMTEPPQLDSLLAAIHPDDRAAWEALLDGLDPSTRLEFRINRTDSGESRWLCTEIARSPDALTGRLTDITAERRISIELFESAERLRLAIEAGHMAIWEVDIGNGRLTNSPELNRLLGLPEDAQPTLAEVRAMYAPGELERLAREGVTYESVKARTQRGAERWSPIEPQRRAELQAEFTLIMPDGTPKELLFRAQYAPAVDTIGQRITGLLIDITDRKRAEQQQQMVAREMQHRVKNSLAVVQAIAAQTFRAELGKDEAAAVFFGRLGAMAAATDALLAGGTDATDLGALLAQVLQPYRSERGDPFMIEGPPVSLSARDAGNLSLAVHELCTNAVKYGALSVAGGSVDLNWSLGDGEVTLRWREQGGPLVNPPTRKGFGSRLLTTAFPRGTLSLDYRPEGLVCQLRFPAAAA